MPLQTVLDLSVFQGPLDLLLELVERRRLEITEISLASVADQYLDAVRALPDPDADILAEFLVIAARLLLLKSRALLPQERVAEEEEPVDDLAARLEQYRQFKEAALGLAARFEAGSEAFPHPPRAEERDHQPPLAPIEAATLARLWRAIQRREPAPPPLEPSFAPRVAVGERAELLRRELARRREIRWEEIAGDTLDEVIATFLAVLELVRRSELTVRQELSFGPIVLAQRGPTVTGDGKRAGSESEELR